MNTNIEIILESKVRKDIHQPQHVHEQTVILEDLYPKEYGSRRSLYDRAMVDGVISEEEYMRAWNHYGKLWSYVGD